MTAFNQKSISAIPEKWYEEHAKRMLQHFIVEFLRTGGQHDYEELQAWQKRVDSHSRERLSTKERADE